MKIIAETPYGQIESIAMDDSVEKIQEILEKLLGNERLLHFTIQTKEGPVILASECAKQSMVRIIE